MSTEWIPLLEGDTRKSAAHAIVEVASQLSADSPDCASLEELCGRAILFGYLAKYEQSKAWRAKAEACVNHAVDEASTEGITVAQFGGLCGLGWTVDHLIGMFGLANSDAHTLESCDPIEDIDDLLVRSLQTHSSCHSYDLITGLVGMGVYCVERLPRASAYEALALILDALEERAEETQEGSSWRTPVAEVHESRRERYPDGYYNLGVAHGVPGPIVLLSNMVVAGIDPPRSHRLMEQSLNWLLARRRPPPAGTVFGSWFVPHDDDADSRLGWCYGDLGIAATLYGVALRANRADVASLSKNILERCLDWPCERDDIADMGLCHGAFGVAHIYNRMFQNTGRVAYRRGAVRWYERGLALRRTGCGVAGFFSWQPASEPSFVDDRSMLSGATGCALALLAGISDISPAWDRRLLLSSRFTP